jgi:GT2 family glycosyltransferase
VRRLDIGICSYGNAQKLQKTLLSIREQSRTDFRAFIIDNPGPDPETRPLIERFAAEDKRFVPVFEVSNIGYAGAVNELFHLAETEYVAYLDNDVQIFTPGWDETLCGYLDRHHELGLMFPNMGHYAINRGAYHECLWAAGFCCVVNRMAQRAVGMMDVLLGHHEEVDLAIRLRLEGYRLGCAPEVTVQHDETSTRSPESQERINAGVIKWMDKWVAYFCGKNVNYHSPNVLRVTDWPVNALYLEEYYRSKLPGLNDNPQTTVVDGVEMDLISIPKPKGFYRSRVI